MVFCCINHLDFLPNCHSWNQQQNIFKWIWLKSWRSFLNIFQPKKAAFYSLLILYNKKYFCFAEFVFVSVLLSHYEYMCNCQHFLMKKLLFQVLILSVLFHFNTLLSCLFTVVFCLEYDRESSDSFTGWAVIRDGPQVQTAHVVRLYSWNKNVT